MSKVSGGSFTRPHKPVLKKNKHDFCFKNYKRHLLMSGQEVALSTFQLGEGVRSFGGGVKARPSDSELTKDVCLSTSQLGRRETISDAVHEVGVGATREC